ncbi:hypothetical protein [Novimethylophilus kurashikiensis]|nr:hypothetical protein [Novimethylophilus kurashikiensis]
MAELNNLSVKAQVRKILFGLMYRQHYVGDAEIDDRMSSTAMEA